MSMTPQEAERILDQKLLQLFLDTSHAQDQSSWAFFQRAIAELPPTYTTRKVTPQVSYYIERILQQLINNPQIDSSGIIQTLDNAFPDIMSNVRKYKPHFFRSASPHLDFKLPPCETPKSARSDKRTKSAKEQPPLKSARSISSPQVRPGNTVATHSAIPGLFDLSFVQPLDVDSLSARRPPLSARYQSPRVPPLASARPPSPRSMASPLTKRLGSSKSIPRIDLTGTSGDQLNESLSPRRHLQLKTGEDAIAFFACQGTGLDMKFVHLNRAPRDTFRPYDLVVVSMEETEPEHFTMSSNGVVHVIPNEPTERYTLSDWVRESIHFNILTSINFFKNYLLRKTFGLWRANVRFKLYCRTRHKISERLIHINPAFTATFLEIKKLSYDISSASILDTPKAAQAFNLEEFAEIQSQRLKETNTLFEVTIEKAINTLHQLSEVIISKTQVSEEDIAEVQMDYVITRRGVRSSVKSKSMVGEREMQERKLKEMHQSFVNAEFLSNFLQMADFLLSGTIVQLVISASLDLLSFLQNKPKHGIFSTIISFAPHGMHYSPSLESFLGATRHILDEMVTAGGCVPRILAMRSLRSFIVPEDEHLPQRAAISNIIRQSSVYIEARKGIEVLMEKDFAGCVEHGEGFRDLRTIHDYGESWNVTQYQATEFTIEQIKSDLERMKKWAIDLERIKSGYGIGVFWIDCKKFKMSLVPIPARCMDEKKTFLISLARTRAEQLLAKYNSHIKYLKDKPGKLQDFTEYVVNLEVLEKESTSLIDEVVKIGQMHATLNMFDVKIPSWDELLLEDVSNAKNVFADAQADALTYVQTRMFNMVQQLDKNLSSLDEQLMTMYAQLSEPSNFGDPSANPKHILETLGAAQEALDGIVAKAEQYKSWQKILKRSPYIFINMDRTIELSNKKQEIWKLFDVWSDTHVEWMNSPFVDLGPESLNEEFVAIYKQSSTLRRQHPEDKVVSEMQNGLEEFKTILPLILSLGNKAMKPRHWKRIFGLVGQRYIQGSPFSLDDLLRWDIMSYIQNVNEVSQIASGEYALEETLEKIKSIWESTTFVVVPYRDMKDVYILSSVDEITSQLEDHLVTLQTMFASRYITGIRDDVELWERKLSVISETLEEWIQCQVNWLYLETVFGQGDIQHQLPKESAQFKDVDRIWKDFMYKTHENPKVIEIASVHGALEMFQNCNKVLEEVEKSLEDYLETKRTLFPRFYFLSNDELIEILAQVREPQAVQPHLRKCFENISTLDFGPQEDEGHRVEGMSSGEGENVRFIHHIYAFGPVEHWLAAVEEMMCLTLTLSMKECFSNYSNEDRAGWMFSYPAQCVLAVDQIIWTFNTQLALSACESGQNANALTEYKKFFTRQLGEMTQLVRGNLAPLQRATASALIVLDVHCRDVLDALVKHRIQSMFDFEWLRQLQYSWNTETSECTIRMNEARYAYGYEYLGNTPRLVITPLTDKCYLTMTNALYMKLGGAPEGPAGTGKTETIKDLAKALARQCVVFNCSDGLDYKMMGRFFAGLAHSGAWACFDEFNRIDIEVLSVIAQQLLTIQGALISGASQLVFEGKTIPVSGNYGCFITMNPGYAGRTELPDNLKALFRPIAMMVPDYSLIAEIMLFSEGFERAKDLASKMVNLYKLCSEQLSKQDHYDFGMRAVKSVLVMAGTLKRGSPTLSEDVVLIRALRDSNLPKFLADDVPLFLAIISDLFPDVFIPTYDYGPLQSAIETQLKSAKYAPDQPFVSKILQLYETQIVRHGVMLVGCTGTGKSVCYHTLAKALQAIHDPNSEHTSNEFISQFHLNPKAISMGELYGEFDHISHEWTDGLVASIMRKVSSEGTSNKKWIIFDGPVDAMWIENMNSVLDDNKTLCLANGERIRVPATVTMMFEVQDLVGASPATVSRCGMVYMEQINLSWKGMIGHWLCPFTEKYPQIAETVSALVLQYGEECIKFVRASCREAIPSTDANLLYSFVQLFMQVVNEAHLMQNDSDINLKYLYNCLLYCIVWSFGCNIEGSCRDKFNTHIQDIFTSKIPELHPILSVYDYYIDAESGNLKLWKDIVPFFEFDSTQPFFDILVPTEETTKLTHLLGILTNAFRHTLISGATGMGKTLLVQTLMRGMDTKSHTCKQISLSAHTTSRNVQEVIESALDKKRKNLLLPTGNRQLMCFVDDINMPVMEKYGAQPPIELLRQCIDQGGFYDRKKLFFKAVQKTFFLAACAPPGGGRNPLSMRFMRHFHMIHIPNVSSPSLVKIFHAILERYMENYCEEVTSLIPRIINATVHVYSHITSNLLPTPSKSHYTFNLRDFAKVIQGITQVKPKDCNTKEKVLQAWCHEASRTFRDRLVDNKDIEWFDSLIQEMLMFHFQEDWSIWSFSNILFGDFMISGNEPRTYREITDPEDRIATVLNSHLQEYNLTRSPELKLVFFQDAIRQVCRISRILRVPRGHALLVGVGGSGKQSLTRVAAQICGFRCFQVEVSKSYGEAEFHEDLKKIIIDAGVKKESLVFLLSDNQIAHESFLETVNNLLSAGEVPNLFALDEREKIIAECRESNTSDTKDQIWSKFVSRVRDNLHIVICLSPVGDLFRNRCRMFPALINCCTISWFHEWPEDALLSVAWSTYRQTDFGKDGMRDSVCQMSVGIHRSIVKASERFRIERRRPNYITPTSFLDFMSTFLDILERQKIEAKNKLSRFTNGISKLLSASDQVANMKLELEKLQVVLQDAAADTAALLEQIKKDQVIASEVRATVEKEEYEVMTMTKQAEAIRDEAEKDLDQAMPIYNAAVKALKSLNKSDVTEVRSFVNPPPAVTMVMEAVCTLKNKPTSWEEAKRLLSDPNFLQSLENFDKDNIPDALLQRVKKFTSMPQFQPQHIEKVSKAAKSLCMWVRAIDQYADIYKLVQPKREKLTAAEQILGEALKVLQEKQDKLADVQGRVAELQFRFDASESKRDEIQRNYNDTIVRLDRAEKLVRGLDGEKKRWEQTIAEIETKSVYLAGHALLSAGVISYCGPFDQGFREDLMKEWKTKCSNLEIPIEPNFTLSAFLGDQIKIREWTVMGLPADSVSLENALIVTRTQRWPLMIDPQQQATKWVTAMESSSKLQVCKPSDPNVLRILENAIRIGTPVLLEDAGEQFEATLNPVLHKEVVLQGGRPMIRVGDGLVDYNSDFRLYIATKLANPHYLPEISSRITIVNFTVTQSGLEDQLLAEVVRFEKPSLEEQKSSLLIQLGQDQKSLVDIENRILSLLAGSQGNILDDEVLIHTLNASKQTSEDITRRMNQAKMTAQAIDTAREEYRLVASRGSLLYFVIADLSQIEPMYQFSLFFFTQLFIHCISIAPAADNLEMRIAILIETITQNVYLLISRGLFEKDKLLFSFLIASTILRVKGEVSQAEWNVFLYGAQVHDQEDNSTVLAQPHWIPRNVWKSVMSIAVLEDFTSLPQEILKNPRIWEEFLTDSSPDLVSLPEPYHSGLPVFQKILLYKIMREDKVLQAICHMLSVFLGPSFANPPPETLREVYKDMTPQTPLMFVIASGADPTSSILELAKENKMEDNVILISLGQGQGPKATKALEAARVEGRWICLQNCHLAVSFLPTLQKYITQIQSQSPHENFRLFLTTMSSTSFPASLLQLCLKLAYEPPKGLKQNLMRVYSEISEDDFDRGLSLDTSVGVALGSRFIQIKNRLILAISFFHGTLQERQKYGSTGFNIPYQWSRSDLEISMRMVSKYLETSIANRRSDEIFSCIPLDALRYMIGEVNYGGRVTDQMDLRCLRSLIGRFFSSNIFGDGFSFVEDDDTFTPPKLQSIYSAYVDFIELLPTQDQPELYGLHGNAILARNMQDAKQLYNTIQLLQPRGMRTSSGAGDESSVLLAIMEMQNSLPEKIDLAKKHPKLSEPGPDGTVNSLTIVVLQESLRFNQLIQLLSDTLSQLVRGLKGLEVMSSPLEKMYHNISLGLVPEIWSNASYPSLRPLSDWFTDFLARVDFFRKWMTEDKPMAFWLPGFFFPHGFFTGVLQNYARKTKRAINTLSFKTHVVVQSKHEVRAEPSDGVYVYGLSIEGAQWDAEKKHLTEASPRELHSIFPVLWFEPTHSHSHHRSHSRSEYACPIYKTHARAGTLSTTGHSTNFITTARIPSDRSEHHWVQRGVALICEEHS